MTLDSTDAARTAIFNVWALYPAIFCAVLGVCLLGYYVWLRARQ